MTDRDQFALLLVMLLVALLLARCGPVDGMDPTPKPICGALWMDCEGIANDYEICGQATDLQYAYIRGEIWFTYVHCDTRVRTQLLRIPDGCDVVWK